MEKKKRPILESIKKKVEALEKENRSEDEKFFTNEKQRKARGKMIRYLREERKISVKDFCDMAGVTQPYLSNIECGTRDMNMNTLDHWLTLLGGRLVIIPLDEI